jgi:branched-chain amino acid aminotransferase
MPTAQITSIDGKITPTPEAWIPAADDGLYRGDGVFEVVRLYAGRPFALTEHLERLGRSAAAIHLPYDGAALGREIEALLEAFGAADAAMRILVTRGGRRLVATEELPAHTDSVKLSAVTYAPSVILTGVKSISYAANMQATRLAAARGADEAVLVRPDGIVLEAPTSTVFWVSAEGPLRTPSIDTGILESITRARIVHALHVEEGEWELDDLRGAPEAFLASTTREIQAVSAIDGRALPHVPGPRTREAASAFAEAIESELAATPD